MAIKFIKGVYIKEQEDTKPFELPVYLVDNAMLDIEMAKEKLHSLMKKQIANVLNNHPEQFDKDITAFLLQFKEHWYSSGLKAMDAMHQVK